MRRPDLVIVTPALADANNGNWRTADRWRRLLTATGHRVRVTGTWTAGDEDVMLALHARRSAPAIRAWKDARADAPLVVALTGTDLYRDIADDADARRSLVLADALVVLNRHGRDALGADLQAKTHVVLQSARGLAEAAKPRRHLRAVAVGHLRAEKDPLTVVRAAERLAARPDIRIDHLGASLDDRLGQALQAATARLPGYRWLGGRAHGETRRRIRDAHVLVHASRMEGGAQVIVEALCSGTPVVVSRIPGNLGLVGDDWPATFDVGDDAGLADLLARLRDDPGRLDALRQLARARAAVFTPAAESRALAAVVRRVMGA